MEDRKQTPQQEPKKPSFLGMLQGVAKQVKDLRIMRGAEARRKAVREHSRIVKAHEAKKYKREEPGFNGRLTQWLGLNGKVGYREDVNGHRVVNTKPRGRSRYAWKRGQPGNTHKDKSMAGAR